MRTRSVAFGLVGLVAVLYRPLLQRRILTWGATDVEAGGWLPGDELLEQADGITTRALTIDAPASAVWPWLAQMGPSPRGGAYTYDAVENLFGLNMHSVDRVLADFQHPSVGDTISLGSNTMRVEQVEPEQLLAWRSADRNWVWTFVLRERDGQTRLISRNRVRLPTLAARLAMILMGPGSLLMEEKMLRGIRERAERLASGRPRRASRDKRVGDGATREEVQGSVAGDESDHDSPGLGRRLTLDCPDRTEAGRLLQSRAAGKHGRLPHSQRHPGRSGVTKLISAVMNRKMLLGIAERAERDSHEPREAAVREPAVSEASRGQARAVR